MSNLVVMVNGVAFSINVGRNTNISQIVSFGYVFEDVFEACLSCRTYHHTNMRIIFQDQIRIVWNYMSVVEPNGSYLFSKSNYLLYESTF